MGTIPLILLHGALGTGAQFDSLLSLLNDFDLHTLDFDGHGRNASSAAPFTVAHFAENVLQLMDAKGISQANFFGYSMGGYVALYLALRHPERVSSLFTLATKLAWNPEFAAKEIGFLDADKILAKVPRFAEALQVQHGDHWRDVLDKTKTFMLGLGENPLIQPADFTNIQHRTRITLGDRDATVTIEESLAAYRTLPNAEFQIFPNTPHPIDRISPVTLAAAIHDFFQ